MIAPFVDAGWLAAHRRDVVLADVRWYPDGRSGRAAYAAGHLPGAVFVDLDADLAGPSTPRDGRHPLPAPQAFAAAMGRAGIGDATTVVAYDDAGGVIAARLVWMLRALGHEAALLDGGPGHDATDPTTAVPEPAQFTARPWPVDLLADADAALAADVLLDARPAGRYAGAPDPLDPRPGHIPGAVSLPARENTDGTGHLLPPDILLHRFESVGVAPGTDVVSSCGSGVTACHTLLLIEHVGLGRGRLYPGSYSAWAADPARPIDTGGTTG